MPPKLMHNSGNFARSGKLNDKTLWLWMINYLKKYKKNFFIMLAFLIIFTIIDASLPGIQKRIIDDGILKGSVNDIFNFSLIYLGFLIVSSVGSLLINYFLGKYGAKIIQEIRLDLFKNIQNMSMDYFETHSSGDIISTATNDIDQLNMVFGGQLAVMLVNLFKALIIIILMVNLNWELAVLSVLIIPVLFLIITFLGSMLRNAFKETRKKISRVTEVIEQNISGMKVIKAYGREKESMEDFDKANWDNREAVFRAGKIMGFLFPLFTFIIYAFMSLILLYGGYGLINNGITLLKSNITIGELSAFNSYLTQLIFPIMGLLLFRQISDSALASAERIYLILHEKNSITEPKVPKDAKKIKGEIEFRNVNFNYKSRMLEEKKDLDTLIGRISNPFYKKFIKKNIHALLEENKLRFVERFVNLSDEEKQSFIAAFNNSYNKKKFIEEFSKKIDLDITTKELSRMLEKKIMGEYPAIKIESQTDINSIGEIIKIKELTTSQILEILVNSKIPKDEYESYSEDVKKLMNEYMLNLKRKKEDVLKDINIKIQKGKTVAFVGETGAGKSTIAKLISRFYDVTSGEILIDGINIKDFKTDELRSVIGMVPQDNFLFSGTILENLYYGLDDKPLLNNKVIKITKKLGLHDFIKELPEKYETKLKEMGTNLSVGQRQLICFARVLMINPKILILDEATSSIDPYTEKIIQSAIKKMSVGRTTIIIAHRLSTIKDADMICVMGNGRIIEKGSHEELVKLKGHYYNLLNASKN